MVQEVFSERSMALKETENSVLKANDFIVEVSTTDGRYNARYRAVFIFYHDSAAHVSSLALSGHLCEKEAVYLV